MSDIKLKHCPFCGSSSEIHKPYGEHGTKFISCSNKNCFMSECKVIAEFWNSRAYDSENAELKAKVAELDSCNYELQMLLRADKASLEYVQAQAIDTAVDHLSKLFNRDYIYVGELKQYSSELRRGES